MRRIVMVVGLVALALIAGACGGGSKSSAPKPSTEPTVERKADGGATTSTAPTEQSAANSGVDPNAPETNPPGDIPDDQVFVAYSPPSGGFSVKVPEGWARSEQGGVVVFTDNLNSVRMETVSVASAPTVASAQQGEVPAITAAARNLASARVTDVTRKAGTAVLITYRADSSPDAVTGKVRRLDVERYEFWRNGTPAILPLSGPQGADNVAPWRIVTDSFGRR
jgi:hypothetical protein